MKRLLVIGIGNTLMQDDGIGALVVNAIKDQLSEYEIEAVSGETDVDYCLDHINPDDSLIIIDAIPQHNHIGNIQLIELNQAIKILTDLNNQHQLSLLGALKIYYPNTDGYLIGIETEQIDMGFNLSERLASKFPQICDNVAKLIVNINKRFT